MIQARIVNQILSDRMQDAPSFDVVCFYKLISNSGSIKITLEAEQ